MLDLVPRKTYKTQDILINSFLSGEFFRIHGSGDFTNIKDILSKNIRKELQVVVYADKYANKIARIFTTTELQGLK